MNYRLKKVDKLTASHEKAKQEKIPLEEKMEIDKSRLKNSGKELDNKHLLVKQEKSNLEKKLE